MTKWRTFIDPSVGDGQDTIDGIIADGSTFGIGISQDLSVTGIATVTGDLYVGAKIFDGDNTFGSSGQVLSSDGTDTKWINTGSLTAGAASEVGITAVNSNSNHFITFVDSSSGNENVKVDTNLTYNPSTNAFGNINVDGLHVLGNLRIDGQLKDGDNLFGGAGTVLTSDGTDTKWDNVGNLSAGSAAKLAVSEDDTETDGRLLFSNAAGQSGGNVVKSDNNLTYNASTNTLTVANITGAVSINDDGNTNAERFITFVDSSSGNNNVKTDASLKYNPSTNTITTVNITGNVTGNLTGNVTGNISGNSGSATVLQTSRTIGGVSFNGSSNINLPGVNSAGNQNTSGNAASATILANTRTIGGVSFNGSANINLPGVNQAGNQNTSGNAATATVLATARNFSISGEITASAQSFNGSGNVTLSATVDDDVIDEANLKISNSPTNGRFLQCDTGVSGGLTWAEVTVPAANTLTGTTLASGITASSITSLGTLTGLSVSGNANISLTTTLATAQVNEKLTVIKNIATPSNYFTGLQMEVRATSGTAGIALHRNGFSHVGIYHDTSNKIKFNMNAGTVTMNHDTGTVWGSGNDGPSSGLNADKLDDQDGSYYRNAGNLNAGTIPDARLTSSSLFVTGMIILWSGASNAIPSGWVLCNGSNNTPDLRGRFVVGHHPSNSSFDVNDTGGSSSITLGTANLPAHTHQLGGSVGNTNLGNHNHSFSGSTNNPGNHNHSYSKPNTTNDDYQGTPIGDNGDIGGTFGNFTTGNAGGHTHTFSGTTGNKNLGNHNHSLPATTGNQGGAMGQSFNNLPPYYALCYIMKT